MDPDPKPDPVPSDPYDFGHPGSESISQRYGYGYGSIVRGTDTDRAPDLYEDPDADPFITKQK